VGINPVPSEIEDVENSAAQIALLKDLSGELSFQDFELILATARSELNRRYPQADAGEGTVQRDSSPAQTVGTLSPADARRSSSGSRRRATRLLLG
jgi:hypothetical protein